MKKSWELLNTQLDINASHYWNHMCKKLMCINGNIKWKPGMYNDATYDPEDDRN